MKKDNLLDFIDTGVFTDDFYKDLSEEVSQYVNAVRAKKGVKNIYGEEDSNIYFNRRQLIALLNHFLKGLILEWDLEYILNYIDMCFENMDEKVEEIVFSISDPYLNFPITEGNIKEAMSYLEEKSDMMNLKASRRKSLREGYRSVFPNNLK